MNIINRIGKETVDQLTNPTEDGAMYQTWLWVLATFSEKDWQITMQSRDGYHCHGITLVPKNGNVFGIRLTDIEARSLWGEKVVKLPIGTPLSSAVLVQLIRDFTKIKIK